MRPALIIKLTPVHIMNCSFLGPECTMITIEYCYAMNAFSVAELVGLILRIVSAAGINIDERHCSLKKASN